MLPADLPGRAHCRAAPRSAAPRRAARGAVRAVARRAVALLGTVAAVVLLTGPPALGDAGPPPGTPTATTFEGLPTVGALFPLGTAAGHTCTASVVDSPGGNLLLTAAHCLAGPGTGVRFVPMYHDGQAPFGVWTVLRTYVHPSWLASQDPRHDYAFAVVAPKRLRHGRLVELQDAVGANRLLAHQAEYRMVRVVGYPISPGEEPVSCRNRSYEEAGYPAFDCHGYVEGTSGGPWLVRAGYGAAGVVGLIGGLHQGGCLEYTSYSPPLDIDTVQTYLRAVAGAPADLLPEPGPDDC
jgi:hypothetical protein